MSSGRVNWSTKWIGCEPTGTRCRQSRRGLTGLTGKIVLLIQRGATTNVYGSSNAFLSYWYVPKGLFIGGSRTLSAGHVLPNL